MKLPHLLVLAAAIAIPWKAHAAAPESLLGCWTSSLSENHWDDGSVRAFPSACSRFFTASRFHVSCRAPTGGMPSTVEFDYTLVTAQSFSVTLVASHGQAYVSDYLRPHDFKLVDGELTVTSYPGLPKNAAGRSLVKTVSRFAAQAGPASSPADCPAPPLPAP